MFGKNFATTVIASLILISTGAGNALAAAGSGAGAATNGLSSASSYIEAVVEGCNAYAQCKVAFSGSLEVNGVLSCGRLYGIVNIPQMCTIAGGATIGDSERWYQTSSTGRTHTEYAWVCASTEGQLEKCMRFPVAFALPPAAANADGIALLAESLVGVVQEEIDDLPLP